MRALVLAALLLAAPLALPTGGADHAFSHRVEVVGRAIDADGRPVPGAPLSLELLGATSIGGCFDVKGDRTNEQGDFHLCRHVHAMDENVTARVTLGNATMSAPVDPMLRRAFVPLLLDETWPVRSIQGERAFARAFLVTGRVVDVQPDPVAIQGIDVNATPRGGAQVNATLLDVEDNIIANGTATTGAYGDYAIELPVGTLGEGARLVVRAVGLDRETDAPADLRRADVSIARESARPYSGPPPGSSPGDVPALGILGGLVALGLGAAAMTRASGWGTRWGRR